jgi:hypothetical protein
MEISRHALVAGSKFTMQCEPLEIILRRDYRYQFKGKCSVKDLGAPSIMEGTAWITASNLLVIKSKPKPESKEEEPKETAPAAKPEPTAREPVLKEIAIEPPPEIVVIKHGAGGLLHEHTQRFAGYRNRKTKVEIRGPCYSACTQITAYVGKADLCIAEGAFFAFHAVRSREKREIMPLATHLFYLHQPLEIRRWIDRNGGYENLPLDGFWTMYDRDLWAMGYPRCK